MVTFMLLNLALAAIGSASILPGVPQAAPGHLSFPIERRTSTKRLRKRDDDVGLINATTSTYLLQLQIGTPAQAVDVVFDTGSFELWIDPTCSTAPTSQQAECENAGSYDYSKSSSVQTSDITNELPYGKGTVDFQYVSDNIIVTGTSSQPLTQVKFGIGAQSTDLAFGIAGVGHGNGFNLEYDNLVDELATQGLTASRAFSVALGSEAAINAGVVVFGGVDTKKFVGKLQQFANLPPQVESGTTGPWRYWVQLASVGITKPGSKASAPYPSSGLPVVLDTGSTLSYLPAGVVSALAADFGATVTDGLLSVPCAMQGQAGSVDFTFGSLTIKVPYSQFIWEAQPGTCFVGATEMTDGTTALLGDSFLRSAYIVFDQTNRDIFLAQYADCGANEQTLPATADAAANFTGQCTASSSFRLAVPSTAGVAGLVIATQLLVLLF